MGEPLGVSRNETSLIATSPSLEVLFAANSGAYTPVIVMMTCCVFWVLKRTTWRFAPEGSMASRLNSTEAPLSNVRSIEAGVASALALNCPF